MKLFKILSLNLLLCTALVTLTYNRSIAQVHQDVMMLNGIVDYEQTELSFSPAEFKHKIQVPGLIDLAEPKIDQYDKYFNGLQDLKYHWYRFKFKVPAKYEKKFAELTLLKSMYNTQIILNGDDCISVKARGTKPNRNISITNSIFWSDAAHAILIGPEANATVTEKVNFEKMRFWSLTAWGKSGGEPLA